MNHMDGDRGKPRARRARHYIVAALSSPAGLGFIVLLGALWVLS